MWDTTALYRYLLYPIGLTIDIRGIQTFAKDAKDPEIGRRCSFYSPSFW
jgi:hypothetical protein